jgi:hypothetical protein
MSRNRLPSSSQAQIALAVLGLALITVSVWAEPIGLDITPGFGVFQVLGSLLGITSLTTMGYLFLASGPASRKGRSLLSDVGMRTGLTGLLTCYVAGLADMLGVGTHQGARFERPYFGPLQIAGLAFGLLLVLIGLFLFWLGRSRPDRAQSQH